jgi:F0F1-type ATP synthase assembly protein I
MRESPSRDWRKVGIAMGAGWLVVSSIGVSVLIGLGLDRLFHTRRLFFIIMFVVGIAAGMYSLVRELRKMDDD